MNGLRVSILIPWTNHEKEHTEIRLIRRPHAYTHPDSQTQTLIGCQRLVCPCSSAHSIRYVRSLLAKRSRVPAQSLGVVTAKRDRDARRFNKIHRQYSLLLLPIYECIRIQTTFRWMCAACHNSQKWLHNHQHHQSPPKAKFDIIDIAIGNRGRSCKKHSVCGVHLRRRG